MLSGISQVQKYNYHMILYMESKKESIQTKQNENGLTENNWVQRDQVEREVGGGIGMGNTCKAMADSCQCMTKPTTVL